MVGKTLVRRQYNDGWYEFNGKRYHSDNAFFYTLMRIESDEYESYSTPKYAIIAEYGDSTSLWIENDITVAFNTYRAMTIEGFFKYHRF